MMNCLNQRKRDDVFSDSNNELLVIYYGLEYNICEVVILWKLKILFSN